MKETKTIQVYPSDAIINSTIEEYQSFGWEVIGNQRCQEYDGQTHGIDGSTTTHYSTFNKITFTREKNASWHGEVSALEQEYYAKKDTANSYRNRKPVLQTPTPDGIIGVALGIYLFCMFIIPGIIYTAVRSASKKKYAKEYKAKLAEYNSVYPAKIEELEEQLADLRARAEKLVSANS